VKSLGQIAYEAYAEHCNWLSVRGERLPDWKNQRPEVMQHWEIAAAAVLHEVRYG
jgi:hypothetical protein